MRSWNIKTWCYIVRWWWTERSLCISETYKHVVIQRDDEELSVLCVFLKHTNMLHNEMMKNLFFEHSWNIRKHTVMQWDGELIMLCVSETHTNTLLCSEMVNWAYFVRSWKPIQTCCYAEMIHWDFWKPNQLPLNPRELQFTEWNVDLWHKHGNGNACKFFS